MRSREGSDEVINDLTTFLSLPRQYGESRQTLFLVRGAVACCVHVRSRRRQCQPHNVQCVIVIVVGDGRCRMQVAG